MGTRPPHRAADLPVAGQRGDCGRRELAARAAFPPAPGLAAAGARLAAAACERTRGEAARLAAAYARPSGDCHAFPVVLGPAQAVATGGTHGTARPGQPPRRHRPRAGPSAPARSLGTLA